VDNLNCRVSLAPFDLAHGDILQGDYSDECRLEVSFPLPCAGAEPVTRIGWRVGRASLMIETVHSYPEEGRGVRSFSRFDLEGARR
jgi:hypothetical protein